MSESRSEFKAWASREPEIIAGLRWDSGTMLSYERCWQASRRAALEQAATVCDDLEDGEERRWAAESCAEAIRALAKKDCP